MMVNESSARSLERGSAPTQGPTTPVAAAIPLIIRAWSSSVHNRAAARKALATVVAELAGRMPSLEAAVGRGESGRESARLDEARDALAALHGLLGMMELIELRELEIRHIREEVQKETSARGDEKAKLEQGLRTLESRWREKAHREYVPLEEFTRLRSERDTVRRQVENTGKEKAKLEMLFAGARAEKEALGRKVEELEIAMDVLQGLLTEEHAPRAGSRLERAR